MKKYYKQIATFLFVLVLSACTSVDEFGNGDINRVHGSERVTENNKFVDKGLYLERRLESLPNEGTSKVKILKDRPGAVLSKWNDFVRMSVKYSGFTATSIQGTKRGNADVIEWKEADQEVHAYVLPPREGMEGGGFEIDVVLNSKPDTNVFEFELEGYEDFDFFYQPELTQEQIAEGRSRAENMSGSYAVYHKSKAGYLIGGVNFSTGKAFHIPRPLVSDDNGVTIYGELSYVNGVLSVTVPQEFLDNAVYPVTVDPQFGYTSIGGSTTTDVDDAIYMQAVNTGAQDMPEDGTLVSMSMFRENDPPFSGSEQWALAVYDVATYSTVFPDTATLIGQTVQGRNWGAGWNTLNASGTVALTTGEDIGLAWWFAGGSTAVLYYDDVADYALAVDETTYTDGNFLTSFVRSASVASDVRVSLYLTYTADVPATPVEGEIFSTVFSADGFHTWTAPTDVDEAYVQCWGGGGGGRDGAGNGAGGGGGGAWASSTVSVTPGLGYTIYVGEAGDVGSDGATSTFATTTLVAAPGKGTNTVDGGLGGATTTSTGTDKNAGGVGGDGVDGNDTSGGGGGAGGPNGGGIAGAIGSGVGTGIGGHGGTGNAGLGGAGGQGVNTMDGQPGSDHPTGGGGGGGSDNATYGGNGGAPGGGGGGSDNDGSPPTINSLGAAGQCIVSYRVPVAAPPEEGGTKAQSIYFFD